MAIAKRLESENLAREAEKQRKLANEAAEAAQQKAAYAASQSREQSQLADLAATRRAELERLAQAAASDNPDILIETVERLEAVLKEVDGQYAEALARSLKASEDGWSKQLVSLTGQKPDMTETDAEFNARIARERAKLEADRQAELSNLRSSAESQLVAQTTAMRIQYVDTLRTLQTKVWTITGKGATLAIGEFDRNERTWSFTVGSAEPLVPMMPVRVVAELAHAADPRAAILALDAAVKAGALVAEIDWGITRDGANKRYAVDVWAVRVKNLTTDQTVASSRPNQRAAYFTIGKRSSPTAARGTLQISSASGVADVIIDGKLMGKTPFSTMMAEGSYQVEVKWPDKYSKTFRQSTMVTQGSFIKIAATKAGYKIGDTGPAGGIIFYDKGNASDGWRFLKAAPANQSDGIQWYNSSYIGIKTDNAIGTGRANTAAIIAAQGVGSYAAAICDSLVIGDYDDWFLPSRDELDLMYENLKKAALGGLGGVWFWSSSQNNDDYAWEQNFSDGRRAYSSKDDVSAVRAVRAF